jgi:hypothetical protein
MKRYRHIDELERERITAMEQSVSSRDRPGTWAGEQKNRLRGAPK